MSEQLVRIVARSKGRGVCRSCGAPLTWAETFPGKKRMPFDGDPVPRRSEHDPETHELIEHLSRADVHWATCPDAKQWKGGGR